MLNGQNGENGVIAPLLAETEPSQKPENVKKTAFWSPIKLSLISFALEIRVRLKTVTLKSVLNGLSGESGAIVMLTVTAVSAREHVIAQMPPSLGYIFPKFLVILRIFYYFLNKSNTKFYPILAPYISPNDDAKTYGSRGPYLRWY